MALFRRDKPAAPEPEPETLSQPGGSGPAKKDKPTPSRKEAEALRRQRITRQLTPREARRESAAKNRAERLRVAQAREAQPEKALLRDYIDARFSVGQFLLPSLVVILALSFLYQVAPFMTLVSTAAMYLFIFAVILDGVLMWRGFKRVLAQRMPKASSKGLLMYAINRMIQIRRFRMPAPRIKRGDPY